MGPNAVAILVGARLVTRSNDTEFRFRQDSDFWYLTGFGHPDAVAVLRTSSDNAYTLFVQPREPEAEVWTGIRPGVDGALADYAADEAHPIGELMQRLPDLLKGAKRVYHVLGRDPAIDRKLVEVQEDLRRRSRAGLSPATELIDPRTLVHEMRLFKEPAELDIMRRGAAITCEAHAEAARLAFAGHHEYELEAVLDYTYRRHGGSGPAYASIVGGGRNAAVLHYITNDLPLVDGELVLIDSGSELEGYASDVTRTYPVGGRFEGERLAVYQVVLAAQEAALEASGPGVTLEDVHDAALRSLVEGMVDISLLTGSVDELIATDSYRPYYMHRTSHWLGLDVHDAGAYAKDEKARPLEPGMVFTVEPGIYIAADAEGADERFRGIGVRIEDDVVVTDHGIENLTAAIPTQPGDVEAWVKAG